MSARRLLVFVAVSLLSLSSKSLAGSKMAKVASVIDGYTIVIDVDGTMEEVRLIGVITPTPTDKISNAAKFGQYATEFLQSLLPKGSWVAVEGDPARRPVAGSPRDVYLFRGKDALFVNEQVVAEGYGIAHTKEPFAYAEVLSQAERKAKASHKGLWGSYPEKAAEWARTPDGQPRYMGVGKPGDSRDVWVTIWILRVW